MAPLGADKFAFDRLSPCIESASEDTWSSTSSQTSSTHEEDVVVVQHEHAIVKYSPLPRISESEEHDPDSESQLDPQGNTVLRIGSETLRVSSDVLRLSCSSNTTIISPDEKSRSDYSIVSTVKCSDVPSCVLMCRALHFHPVEPPRTIEDISSFADVCNRYAYARALSPLVHAWLSSWKLDKLELSDLNHLLWVAWVFRLTVAFSDVSLCLAIASTPDEIGNWDTRSISPSVKSTVEHHCLVSSC